MQSLASREHLSVPGLPGGVRGQVSRRGVTASEDPVLKSCPSDTFSSIPEKENSPPRAGWLITHPAQVGRGPWKLITEIYRHAGMVQKEVTLLILLILIPADKSTVHQEMNYPEMQH